MAKSEEKEVPQGNSVGNDGKAIHHPACVSVWDPKAKCDCGASHVKD